MTLSLYDRIKYQTEYDALTRSLVERGVTTEGAFTQFGITRENYSPEILSLAVERYMNSPEAAKAEAEKLQAFQTQEAQRQSTSPFVTGGNQKVARRGRKS